MTEDLLDPDDDQNVPEDPLLIPPPEVMATCERIMRGKLTEEEEKYERERLDFSLPFIIYSIINSEHQVGKLLQMINDRIGELRRDVTMTQKVVFGWKK
jgi:hypothetical protein